MQKGKTYHINDDDYFALPRQVNLKANMPFKLKINKEQNEYKKEWVADLIQAYDVRGLVTLTAFLEVYLLNKSERCINLSHFRGGRPARYR